MNDANNVYKFVTSKSDAVGAKAIFTLVSRASGARFTYKVTKAKKRQDSQGTTLFVSVLTGSDNQEDYTFLGTLWQGEDGTWPFSYKHGRKSKIGEDAPSARAFDYFWRYLRKGQADILDAVEFWHEGVCGRCGRPLTVPESIELGLGPECAGKA